jgi:UDP:flavonoid glycosyltransferase YjiC (YdhE family)
VNLARSRLLFIPVSGPTGMGEYGRALAIANVVAQRQPDAAIHFALSREAPYAATVPFHATLLPSSPTFHSPEIVALIHEFRPTTVVFDNAGRTTQLRAASQARARVIFISARARQRRKAFRLHWMRLIDDHWLAYPKLLAGDLNPFEQLKLRALRRPAVRFLNPVLPGHDARRASHLLAQSGLSYQKYIALVPGGGTAHAGSTEALQAFADAAALIAASGQHALIVGLDVEVKNPRMHVAPRMPLSDLAEILRGAKVVICNGGYTLLQALACDRPCVAVALVKDQSSRIDRCVAAGIAVRGEPNAEALTQAAATLAHDGAKREAMRAARAKSGIENGAEAVARALLGSGG